MKGRTYLFLKLEKLTGKFWPLKTTLKLDVGEQVMCDNKVEGLSLDFETAS